MDRLKHHCDTRSGFILVDVAGVCQKTTIQAATVADLTITPSKLSAPDIIEAAKLHRELTHVSTMIRKPILHRVLLNEVSPLWPTYQTAALEDLKRSGVEPFGMMIHQRALRRGVSNRATTALRQSNSRAMPEMMARLAHD
jgi:chromosome partitioning protein